MLAASRGEALGALTLDRPKCMLDVRGEPGLKDEPQHALMGEATGPLLDVLRVAHQLFPEQPAQIAPTLAAALTRLLELLPERAAVIATTGKTGRELFTLNDRPQHLYQVGSMGCAAAMGLGVALNVARPVVVIDGDGAAPMKLGNCATIGARAPKNLVHLVLDNGVHDSTGGQRTVSASVDFADVALACGYASGTCVDELAGFASALTDALASDGPHLIHLRIAPGALAKLGRPTIAPPQMARRFQEFLQSN